VTRERIFLETLEDILGRSNKVIIEGGQGQGVVPYLPLPEIQKRQDNSQPTGQVLQQGGSQQ
jgi:membrane protease subunit HflK